MTVNNLCAKVIHFGTPRIRLPIGCQ